MVRGTTVAGVETTAVGTGMIGCRSELERRRPTPRLLRGRPASCALAELLSKRAGLLLLLELPFGLVRLARLDPIEGWLALSDVVAACGKMAADPFPGVLGPEPLLDLLRCFPCYNGEKNL